MRFVNIQRSGLEMMCTPDVSTHSSKIAVLVTFNTVFRQLSTCNR